MTLASAPGFHGGSWDEDDTIVFSTSAGLLRVPAGGGTPKALTRIDSGKGEVVHGRPALLPGGRGMVFAIWSNAFADTAQVVVQSLEDGTRDVLGDGNSPYFTSTGHLVFARSDSLWTAPFDPDRLEMTGTPVLVQEGVQVHSLGLGMFTVAADGTLAYVPGGLTRIPDALVWVDRMGATTDVPIPPGERFYWFPRFSPDGTRVAVHVGDEGNRDVWMYDVGLGTLRRLTSDESFDGWPIWTPDGERLTFSATDARDLHWQPTDGHAPAELLLAREHRQYPISWLPDGSVLAFTEVHPETGNDIWLLSLPDRTAQPLAATTADERGPMFSPDGRWLAYTSDESGQDEVYVQPYPGPGSKRLVSTSGGNEVVWSTSGQELFYRRGDRLMVVPVTDGPTFAPGSVDVVFTGAFERGVYANPSYDISPDGSRFIMIRSNRDPTLTRLTVVLNWFEELKARAPVN